MSTNKTVGYGLIGVTAAILALALAVFARGLTGSSDTTLEHIGYMLRVTARMAFVMLLLAYVARPIRQLTGKGIGLMRLRRYLDSLPHLAIRRMRVMFMRTSGSAVNPSIGLPLSLAVPPLYLSG